MLVGCVEIYSDHFVGSKSSDCRVRYYCRWDLNAEMLGF